MRAHQAGNLYKQVQVQRRISYISHNVLVILSLHCWRGTSAGPHSEMNIPSDHKSIVMHAPLIQHIDGLDITSPSCLETGDALETLVALLVNVNVHILHLRQRCHLDTATPATSAHLRCIGTNTVVTRVVFN